MITHRNVLCLFLLDKNEILFKIASAMKLFLLFIIFFPQTNFLCENSFEGKSFEIEEFVLDAEKRHEGEVAATDLSFIRQNLPKIPEISPSYKNASIAACLAVIPGLGHVYLDDMKTAGSFFSSTGLAFSLGFSMPSDKPLSTTGLLFAQNTEMYGIYAAYRDARLKNGMSFYSYRMPTENLSDLAYAPFQWSVIKKPEVWGGILGMLLAGSAMVHFGFPDEAHIRLDLSRSAQMPLFAFPIGIGEESFFRGYLQSTLSEVSSPLGGVLLSSLAFGSAHIPTAWDLDPEDRWRYYSFAVPFITGMGAYLGWLTYKNHSLKESVALHAWYDFILMAASTWISYKAATGESGFAAVFDF